MLSGHANPGFCITCHFHKKTGGARVSMWLIGAVKRSVLAKRQKFWNENGECTMFFHFSLKSLQFLQKSGQVIKLLTKDAL